MTAIQQTAACRPAGRTGFAPILLAQCLQRALARGWVLAVALVVYVPFYLVYFSTQAPFSLAHAAAVCGAPVLDTRWSYSAQSAAGYLDGCGEIGRSAVAAQQLADLVYPLLYSLVLASALALLLGRLAPTRRGWHLLMFLPILTALADYIENIGVWYQLAAFPSPAATAVSLFSLATCAKQLLSYTTFAVLGVLLITVVIQWARARHAHQVD